MSWHIGDYKKDTGHLRAAGHGAYVLLCMHYWATGGLPDDDKQLAAIACMTSREWKAHRPTIKALFKGEGGPWRHKRIDKELADAQIKYERRASAGREGGKAKANQHRPSSNATAKSKQPITDNPKEVVVAADAHAREPLVSKQAHELADKLARLCGHDLAFVPPAWAGAPMRVQAWLTQGWKPEIIVVAVQRTIAKRKTGPPINSVHFFENAIAEEHARQAKPLPTIIEQPAETIEIRHGQDRGRPPQGSRLGFGAIAAELAARRRPDD